MGHFSRIMLAAFLLGIVLGARAQTDEEQQPGKLLTGKAAMGDWKSDAPGVRRKIIPADLPEPYDTKSVDNGPRIVKRPAGASPQVPPGFKVDLFADELENPRVITAAPNGDIFVAESRSNQIRVLRDENSDGKPEKREVYTTNGLRQPFGIAFYPVKGEPTHVYVANTDSVIRYPYKSGDLEATSEPEKIVTNISGGGQLRGGGHWTRDIQFSLNGAKMWVSVGSRSNVSDDESEARRARIYEYSPDGSGERLYAWGIRNPVGLAVHPTTGELWTSVNERDALGDDLVPDYVTRVKDGGFYGWPWYYIGKNQDPRHKGKHPELRDKVIVPDVLIQSHSASLDMAFYDAKQFPAEYQLDAFAAQHGSWNRDKRTGYKVVQIPVENGVPTGEYVDFMTGFVTPDGDVWGRPVGLCVAKDGSMLVSDDGGDCIWRITYTK